MDGSNLSTEAARVPVVGLYVRNLLANAFGLIAVALFNLFTPLGVYEILRALIIVEGGWVVFALHLSLLILITLLQHRFQLPIFDCIQRMQSGEPPPESFRLKAKRRLLNLPFFIGFIDLAMWTILPAMMLTVLSLFGSIPAHTVSFTYFRTAMIGMIAATMAFFLVKEHSRKRLIPLLFPEGRLASVPGTLRVSIGRRIWALYFAGTFVPMIILVGTFFFIHHESKTVGIGSVQFAGQVFVFTAVVCGIFLIVAMRLNSLVAESISKPLEKILLAAEKVRDGDFDQRIQVVSNDEIGVLGDAGNDMIAGLREREQIREAFGKYVSPEIRDQILSGRIPMDGDVRVATLLFSDLRGFTAYVERNPPEEVIQGMRAYFTLMQEAIRAHGGLVLQYVGDEIEAVFGVPLDEPDHGEKAILAALEMRIRLEALNSERLSLGLEPFAHGIGIHTGRVLAGTVGSRD